MERPVFWMLVVALALGVLLSCDLPTVTPTPVPTVTGTSTPTIPPTFTFTPTSTATPTNTPTLAPTMTATPTFTPMPMSVVTTTVIVGWDEYVVIESEYLPPDWYLRVDREMQAGDGTILASRSNPSDCQASLEEPGDGKCEEITEEWTIPEAQVEGGARLWLCLTWTSPDEEVVRCKYVDQEE
jgi:hypothetical protein